MQSTYQELPLTQLQPGTYQPRQHFSETALQELAISIKTQGLIEPLIVRAVTANRFEIIAGERRFRAAQMAGLTTVPCLIGQYSDQQACALTLIENIQREDLNLIEEATGYQRLIREFHYQQDEIAALVGKSRSHIANLLRLLSLCPTVQQAIINKELSLGHARMLVGLEPALQSALCQQIQTEDWSVRQLEQQVKAYKNTPTAPKSHQKDRDTARLESTLSEQVGAPVEVCNDSEQGGWLKIKYFDNETLAGLLERLGLRYD